MCKKLIYPISLILLFGLFTGAANADITSALVAYYPLDGDATDASGNGNDGTFMGSPQSVPGKFGQALEFDGLDYVQVEGYIPISGAADRTVTAWIKMQATGVQGIVSWGVVSTQNKWVIRLDNGMLRCEIEGASVRGDTLLNDGEWHHTGVSFANDGTPQLGDVELYVDGVLEAHGQSTLEIDTSTTGNLEIGRNLKNDGFFQGSIDDVRIYDRALTEDEIQTVMEGGDQGFPLARGPNPPDGSLLESTWINLSWRAGDYAVSHDMYLGDNFDDVNDGVGETFRGNQTATNYVIGFPGFAYPDGLVPGTMYYWRIDEVNDADPNSPWKGFVWSFFVPPREAYNPNPSNGAKFIDPNIILSWAAGMGTKMHTVYFDENFDDVNSAVGGLLQSDTTYTPGTLELEKTYYWRVDEFDGVETHKGDVWDFTTLPEITVTDPNLIGWWTFDEGMGTIALDWSGHGNHGTLFGPEWIIPGLFGDAALNPAGGYVAIQNLTYNSTGLTELSVCAWINTNSPADQYIASFDRSDYWRLEINGNGGGDGQVGWSVNTSAGQVDLGSVTRVDNGAWRHVCGVFDNGLLIIYIDGSAEPSVTAGSTFGSGNTRFGFICANSEATSFNGSRGGGAPISGEIDDVRIYDKALTQEEITLVMRGDPLLAWDPNPTNGSTPYIRDATPLSWSPGDMASSHEVYFGTDRNAVKDADTSDITGIYRGRQSGTSYTPTEGVEWGGGPYYWRIDEYNTDGAISKGRLWSFTIADFIVIEDFEDYNDYQPDEIWSTWLDGYGIETNGSTVGYPEPDWNAGEHYVETTIVHSGSQSMPLFYDNNFKYSEATMTLVTVRNWTEEGVGVLSLWFYGDTSNAAERMYVALNGSAVVYHDDPSAALINTWTEWTIDLQEFAAQGVNLANVNTITIGFGDKNNLQAGGSGMVFFDDIRLYRPAPEPEPAP